MARLAKSGAVVQGLADPRWQPYPIHLAAIALGRESPFVESSYLGASQNPIYVWPTGLGVLCGALIRSTFADDSRLPRSQDRPFTLVPTSTRGWLRAIAATSILLGSHRILLRPPTIYARQYNEAILRLIKLDMTTDEVEATAGPPMH